VLLVACATGRAYNARQVKGDDSDKKGYPGTQVWELGMRLTSPPRKKNTVTKSQGNETGRISQQ